MLYRDATTAVVGGSERAMTFGLRSGEHADPKPRLGFALSRSLVLLLLLCFVVQGTAVQSHVHFVAHASPALAGSSTAHLAAPSSKGDSPVDCPLCQEAAMAGSYVLPSVPVLPPPPALVVWTAVAAMAAFTLLTPTLGWLSRAPPE